MDYNGSYSYGPYYNLPQLKPQKEKVPIVNGRGAVEACNMAPDSSKIFMDQAGFMWLVTTDSVGYKTICAYDVTPRNENPAPVQSNSLDMASISSYAEKLNEYTAALDARITKLEGVVNGNNGTTPTKQEQYPTITSTASE